MRTPGKTNTALNNQIEQWVKQMMGDGAQRVGVPKAGVDVPVYPPPTPATADINEDTNEATLNVHSLTAFDLLGEGIESRSDVEFWCGYCSTAVSKTGLGCHIIPSGKVGRSHHKNKKICLETLEQLQDVGWSLKYEGMSIEKEKFKCQYCESGLKAEWWNFYEHLTSSKHERKKKGNWHIATAGRKKSTMGFGMEGIL